MYQSLLNKKIFLLFISVFIFINVHARAFSDTVSIHQLLLRLEQLQSTNNNQYFSNGIFPSWREYAVHKGVVKADENIFYTGLIVFTLKKYYPFFSEEDKTVCDSIIARAMPAFSKFKNVKGMPTCNFWQTNPPVVFPNSKFLNWFSKSNALPDDADDTVISWLALKTNDSIANAVHQLLIQHANLQQRKIKNTYKKYKNIPAYSTWFGVKMPIDFDVCVLCNVLYFMQQYRLPWAKQDTASLHLITQVIKDKKYLTNAAYVSPHYHRTAVIMYHVSRLFSALNDSCFDNVLKEDFINEVKKKFSSSKNIMDKILLNISLMKLKETPLPLPDTTFTASNIEQSKFIFFIADMSSFLSNFYRVPISKTGLVKFNYYCPAYNITLLIEYFALHQQKIIH